MPQHGVSATFVPTGTNRGPGAKLLVKLQQLDKTRPPELSVPWTQAVIPTSGQACSGRTSADQPTVPAESCRAAQLCSTSTCVAATAATSSICVAATKLHSDSRHRMAEDAHPAVPGQASPCLFAGAFPSSSVLKAGWQHDGRKAHCGTVLHALKPEAAQRHCIF